MICLGSGIILFCPPFPAPSICGAVSACSVQAGRLAAGDMVTEEGAILTREGDADNIILSYLFSNRIVSYQPPRFHLLASVILASALVSCRRPISCHP